MRTHVTPYRLVLGIMLAILAAGLIATPAAAVTREFLLVTGEWSWKAKTGEAPVTDRDRGAVTEIERYSFDPAFIVVNKGDTVVLKIHTLKGDHHLFELPAFGVKETKIARGEEKVITFVAKKAGIFEFRCNNHTNAQKEGPMVGYLYVNGR